jgi:hypothetical protein
MRFLALILASVSVAAFGLERDLVVGSEGALPWAELEQAAGTTTRAGWRGLPDLVLEDASYPADASTELLLHFDSVPPSDAAGRYSVLRPGAMLLSAHSTAFGGGAAAFEGGDPTVLEPVAAGGSQGLLGAGDWSIELWLSPLHLGDGETVLAWTAPRARDGAIRSQSITARVRGRTLEWKLEGMFLQGRPLTLKGVTLLVPERWAHHLLRYDAGTGLLEYLVDGVPEAVAYATASGADASPPLALVGDAGGRLLIGERLTGLLDEMRVSHRRVERPQIARYGSRAATAVTRPLDLGQAGSRLLRIEVVASTPGASAIDLAYRISEDPFFDGDAGWKPFSPSAALDPGTRGRFVQLRADLMSDGRVSPALSRLRVVYEPNMPPPPPGRVVALAGDSSITLSWQRVHEDDVAGYLVYYGPEPGSYDGTGSSAGPSPVDAGNALSFKLQGLTNGRLYYMAVVSYDQAYPRQQSRFSPEVVARPSPLAAGAVP